MSMTLKHIKFGKEDLQAVAQVQRLYGCESFSQAVRLAARIAAQQKRFDMPLPPVPKHTEGRQPKSLRGIIQLSEEAAEAMDNAIHQAVQFVIVPLDEDDIDAYAPFAAIPEGRDRMIATATMKMDAPLLTVDQEIIASGAVQVLE